MAECSSLKELILNGCNALTDLKSISSIPSLELLRLSGLPVKNIDFVKNLSNLKELYLVKTARSMPVEDISSLSNLLNLEELYLTVYQYMTFDHWCIYQN